MKTLIVATLVTLATLCLSGCGRGEFTYTPPAAPAIQPSATPVQPLQIASALIETPTATQWPTATPPPLPTATSTPVLPPSPDIPTPRPLKATATRTLVPARPSATPTATRTPIVIEPVSACPGAPALLNKPETYAQISIDPPISNRVRSEPGLAGEITGELMAGEVVWVEAGPRCADGLAWWYVRSLAGREGWTAEGDAAGYWLIQPLNTFFYNTTTQGSASKAVLEEGKKYRVVMAGNYSLWIVPQWTDAGVCIRGEAEPLPMFPSPGKKNGPVGLDPFYWYARPFYGPCQELTDPSETVSKIMFSLDGGKTYAIPAPRVEEYRPDHTYTLYD